LSQLASTLRQLERSSRTHWLRARLQDCVRRCICQWGHCPEVVKLKACCDSICSASCRKTHRNS